jgi:Fe-S cluster biogenesis protein NfuA
MHGGGMDLVSADETTGEVRVRFRGACVGCPLSALTLGGIIEEILGNVPGVNIVSAVTDEQRYPDAEQI